MTGLAITSGAQTIASMTRAALKRELNCFIVCFSFNLIYGLLRNSVTTQERLHLRRAGTG